MRVNIDLIKKLAKKKTEKLAENYKFIKNFQIARKFTYGISIFEGLVHIVILSVIGVFVIPFLIKGFPMFINAINLNISHFTLDQSIKKIMDSNSGTLTNVFKSSDGMMNELLKNLKYTKRCSSGQSLGNCWHNNDGNSYFYNGIKITNWSDLTGAVLDNGSMLLVWLGSSECNYPVANLTVCGGIILDVNGFKEPNTVGKDIFYLHVVRNGLKPYGTARDPYSPDSTCIDGSTDGANYGYGCASKYLL